MRKVNSKFQNLTQKIEPYYYAILLLNSTHLVFTVSLAMGLRLLQPKLAVLQLSRLELHHAWLTYASYVPLIFMKAS